MFWEALAVPQWDPPPFRLYEMLLQEAQELIQVPVVDALRRWTYSLLSVPCIQEERAWRTRWNAVAIIRAVAERTDASVQHGQQFAEFVMVAW
jgi:hypothetical protein